MPPSLRAMAASMVSPQSPSCHAASNLGRQTPNCDCHGQSGPRGRGSLTIFFAHGAKGSMDILMACPSKERSSSLEGVFGGIRFPVVGRHADTPRCPVRRRARGPAWRSLPAASSWRMKGARYRPPKPRVAPRKKVRRVVMIVFLMVALIKRNLRTKAR